MSGQPRRVAYPGRDRLDAASNRFRKGMLSLSVEALSDERLAGDLAELVDAATDALHGLAARAEAAALRSGRHQARVRRELTKAEKLERRATSDLAQEVAQRQIEHLRTLLVDAGSDGA